MGGHPVTLEKCCPTARILSTQITSSYHAQLFRVWMCMNPVARKVGDRVRLMTLLISGEPITKHLRGGSARTTTAIVPPQQAFDEHGHARLRPNEKGFMWRAAAT